MSRDRVYCAAESCAEQVQPGMLMCKSHWFSLPEPLRDNVWSTWRAYNATRRGQADARLQRSRMSAYREAVQAATDYVASAPKSPREVFTTTARQGGKILHYGQGRLL